MGSRAPRGLRLFQIVLWSAVAVTTVLYVGSSLLTAEPAILSVPQKSLGPGVPMTSPFTLVTDDGNTVTEVDFVGKAGAWFYGFTNCPDVCPTALAEMAQLLDELGDDAKKLNAVFVTVDPERDTRQVIKEYVGYFDERIIGLTGSVEQIKAMARQRFVSFEKIPRGDPYAMQHPAGIFLTDAEGNFVGTLDSEEPMPIKLGKLRMLIES